MRAPLAALLIAIPLLAKDSCIDCHSKLEGDLQAPAVAFANDIHARFGFSCSDCHGGDKNADDLEKSMSPARGFVGKIPRIAVPKRCAHCHSDANVIHKFRPRQRIDQLALYQTSVHGKRLAAGDTAVANCVDCHGVHSIREVKDPLSPVHPLRLPETCARCGSHKMMEDVRLRTDVNDSVGLVALVHTDPSALLLKGAVRGHLRARVCGGCGHTEIYTQNFEQLYEAYQQSQGD